MPKGLGVSERKHNDTRIEYVGRVDTIGFGLREADSGIPRSYRLFSLWAKQEVA